MTRAQELLCREVFVFGTDPLLRRAMLGEVRIEKDCSLVDLLCLLKLDECVDVGSGRNPSMLLFSSSGPERTMVNRNSSTPV